MPKKRTRTFIARPADTAHHTLLSSEVRERDRFRPTASCSGASVNDLISHLRRTQIPTSADESHSSSSPRAFTLPRSVPPSLRTVLDLPEAQTPRSRPNAPPRTVLGVRPRRPTPGPAPPESWLSEGSRDSALPADDEVSSVDAQKIIYRLQRLPYVSASGFPEEQSLKHAVLKSMASNFAWHVQYDGTFLTQLPWHTRALLLSYVACFGREKFDKRMGLKLLFPTQKEYTEMTRDQPELADQSFSDAASLITRFDLGGAMGNWLSFRQLTNALFVPGCSSTAASLNQTQATIPDSWDQCDVAVSEHSDQGAASTIPISFHEGLRFTNLRYLSLAHPNPRNVSWDSLLRLLPHLSTITHLSLAHWPAPCHGSPRDRPLCFTLWTETSSILRELSRQTYCLRWLDLEGCSDWIFGLTWDNHPARTYTYPPELSGPEWNKAWRNIQWINLAPGWNLVDMKAWNSRPLGLPADTKTGISILDFHNESLTVPAYSTPKDLGTFSRSNSGAKDEESLFLQLQAFIRYRKTVERWHQQICHARNTFADILQIRGPRGKRIQGLTGEEGLDMEYISRFLADTAPLADQFLRENPRRARAE